MKIHKYLQALATLVLVACSQDDNIPTPQSDVVDIRASIVYGDMTGGFTRSGLEGTSFSDKDVIAVTTSDKQGPVEYTLTNNEWKAEEGKELKWTLETLNFTSWYPVTEGTSATDFTLPETLTSGNISQWDYMTATTENATKEKGVELKFERKMVLVVIEDITVDKTVFGSDVSVSSITLHSNSNGYEDGKVKEETSEITMLLMDNKYYAIISPTTEANAETFLTITLSNNETAIVKGISTLKAGNKYTYKLNVGREAIVASVSVNPWTESTDILTMDGGLSYTISTDGNTYIVYRAHGLMAWNTAVQSNKGLNLTLGADINMAGVTDWQQVADYTGTITGNGYTVSGLSMTVSEGNAGFIAELGTNGKIVNLNLASLTVTGSATNVGGLVGENNGGTVGACSVTGDVTASSATNNVGGLVGLNNSGLVLSSYCTGAVSGGTNAGTIAGKNTSEVTGCYYVNNQSGIGAGDGDVTWVDGSNVKWTGEQNTTCTDEIAVIIMNQLMKEWAIENLNGKGWVEYSGTSPLVIGDADFSKVINYVKVTSSNTYKVYTATGLGTWNNSCIGEENEIISNNLNILDNIDMAYQPWTTLGYSPNRYNATINGNGKIISNLLINKGNGFDGFVGDLGQNGIIKDLHLQNVTVDTKGASYVGGIAGACQGLIIGCSVSGTVKTTKVDVGGIVGVIHDSGKVIACYNMASATTNSYDSGYGAGGIAGRHSGETIIGCYNVGKVYYGSKYRGGGIVGRIEVSGSNPGVESCYWQPVSGNNVNGGIGETNGTGATEAVEIKNSNWDDALEDMNKALENYGYGYVANGNNTTEPLKLVKTGN